MSKNLESYSDELIANQFKYFGKSVTLSDEPTSQQLQYLGENLRVEIGIARLKTRHEWILSVGKIGRVDIVTKYRLDYYAHNHQQTCYPSYGDLVNLKGYTHEFIFTPSHLSRYYGPLNNPNTGKRWHPKEKELEAFDAKFQRQSVRDSFGDNPIPWGLQYVQNFLMPLGVNVELLTWSQTDRTNPLTNFPNK